MSEAISKLLFDLFKAIKDRSGKAKDIFKSLQSLLESSNTPPTTLEEKLKNQFQNIGRKTFDSLPFLLPSMDPLPTVVQGNIKNPFKNTNWIILCCEFGQLSILSYFLTKSKLFIANAESLSPFDTDDEGHSAFYYAIRSNDVGILELLLTKWTPYAHGLDHRKDFLLSKAYGELKLRNVKLTESMEFSVENEIIAARFFSKIDNGSMNDSSFNLLNGIDWLLTNIDSLKTEALECKFMLLAESIAQNMNILKYQLKATYDTIPWEELEFCVISYIVPRIHHEETNVLQLVAITKETLLSQLGHFAAILRSFSLNNLLGPNEFPNLSRDEVMLKIKKNSPEFILLYEIYQKARDLYSLEKIEKYLDLSFFVYKKDELGKLAILRVLYILSDYLKNSLDNCKLSGALSKVILSALPRKTRNVVIELRNTVSLAHSMKKRLEIEKKSHAFFRDVQNDLKQLSSVISRILNKERLKIVVDFLEKITRSDNVAEISELCKTIKFAYKCIDVGNLKLFEEEKIRKLICELRRTFPDLSDRETRLFEDTLSSLRGTTLESNIEPFLPVDSGARLLECLDNLQSTFDRAQDECDLPHIKQTAVTASRILSPTSDIDKMSKVSQFINEIDEIINSAPDSRTFNEDKMYMLLFEISLAATSRVEDVVCFELTEDDDGSVEGSEVPLSKIERENNLKSKINGLNTMLGSEAKSAVFLKENGKLRLATELLLLDVLSNMRDDSCESEKAISLGKNTPVLIGKSLKNYLAHGSALVDIFQIDPVTSILSNAIQFIKKNQPGNLRISKDFWDEISVAKERLTEKMKIMDNQDQLFRSLEKGDMKKSQTLFKSGADEFGRNIRNESTLHIVAKSPNIDFTFAQKVGADLVDIDGRTALHVAAAHGNINLIEHFKANNGKIVLEQKDKNGQTYLHLAAKHGQTETVALLLKMGADISPMDKNSRTPLFLAIENNSVGVVETMLDIGADMDILCEKIGQVTPLHVAAKYNRCDIIKLMLQKGADVDIYNEANETPLITAAVNDCAEAVKILVKARANVNEYSVGRFENSPGLFTGLHFASDKGHTAVAAILLQNGADGNTPKNPDKPIHFAARKGRGEIVKLLIEHKADVNCRDSNGLTPLHLAAQRGHANVIENLLEAGADMESCDKKGSTALHIAVKNGCLDVVKMLLKYGAAHDVKNQDGATPKDLASNDEMSDVFDCAESKRRRTDISCPDDDIQDWVMS